MGAECRKAPPLHDAIFMPIGKFYLPDLNLTQLVTIAIVQHAIRSLDTLSKLIHKVGSGGGVHPAGVFIKTLINEELAPGHCAIGIKPLFTDHMDLAAKKERGMGVD